jgi:cytochrome P450
MLHMINRKLTTSLALITAPVNEENNIAMKEIWPETKEWKPTPFVNDALLLTSQVSSRIFLGAPICRNPEWIKLGKDYTVDLMTAAYTMRYMPRILRPVLYYILPPIYKLKATIKAASAIIEPEINQRRKLRSEAIARGESIPKRLDSIDWMDDIIHSQKAANFDIVGAQLTLTFVAVHTTSNTLAHLLYDLIDNPELIPELRQEIIAVMEEDQGWQKTSLYKLKLLDSVMKESQRMNILGNRKSSSSQII